MKKSDKLNLGCGLDIKEGYVNIDKKRPADVLHDLNKFPYPFGDNAFGEVHCDNILEHLTNLVKVMEELHRIAKPNAKIRIIVPYWHNFNAFRDITHKHFFSMESFDAFTNKDGQRYYYSDKRFEITKKELVPTIFGRLIPKKLLNFFALFAGNIADKIIFELKVVK